MDLRFSAEELAFRDELRGFIRDNLTEDIREKLQLGHKVEKPDIVRWQRILNKKGWAAYNWPKEWGGPGWTPTCGSSRGLRNHDIAICHNPVQLAGGRTLRRRLGVSL